MKKRVQAALLAAMVLASGILSGCGRTADEQDNNMRNTQVTEQTPAFMYFVSNSDADFDKTNEIVEELQAEYEGRVQFKVVNIDEDESGIQSLVSEGQTPTLIMTNKSGEAEIKSMCSDKEELKECIENALK